MLFRPILSRALPLLETVDHLTVRPVAARLAPVVAWRPDTYQKWFLMVVAIALAMRVHELAGRTVHYDEALHLYYGWKLAQGEGFQHSPWMHGPFQIELVAAFVKFVGDSTFIARLPYALFGTVMVGLPYLLRDQLGRWGALAAAVLMAASPVLLYFSRFGRNDIIMVVGATLLLITLWRYQNDGRARHLMVAAVTAAVMLCSKETSYFILLYFGLAAAAMGIRPLLALARRPVTLPNLRGGAGFFILVGTLAVPHAAAVLGIGQGLLGLELVAAEDGGHGDTGAPAWNAPYLQLPLLSLPAGAHFGALAVASMLMALFWTWKAGRRSGPLAWLPIPSVRGTALSLLVMATLGLVWTLLLVDGGLAHTVGVILPQQLGVKQPDLDQGLLSLNFAVAVGVMGLLFLGGAVLGILWNARVWVPAALLFHGIWITLYTTFFTNAGGIFTGSWQSLGYWIAQQEVARGNQPWYYYLVGLTVYETAALAFGVAAVVWLTLRRRNAFDLLLAGWVLASLVTYTVASEKMPWLMVNLVVPLALAAGALLGRAADPIPWRHLEWRHWVAVVAAPLCVAAVVWLGWQATSGEALRLVAWTGVLVLLPALGFLAWTMRREIRCWQLAALGVAVLLVVGVSVPGAVRAAYTYDDSNVEMLVFAQGSADLWDSYRQMRHQGLLDGALTHQVAIDWELWYPMQWYTRHDDDTDAIEYSTKCQRDSGCPDLERSQRTKLYLASLSRMPAQNPTGFVQSEIRRNLLWHPETYRRPGEQRTETSMGRQVLQDFKWLGQLLLDRQKVRQVIEYVVTRRMETDWFRSEYYQFERVQARP